MSNRLIVTQHAINRYRERTDCKLNDNQIEEKILEYYGKSEKVDLRPEYKAIALLNHNFKQANYYRFSQFILVVEGMFLKTIHFGQAKKRWVSKA